MNENIILIGAGLGQMQTNCYIAGNRQTKEALVFDPGDEGYRVMEMLEKEGLELTAVLLTHGHFDHVMALPYLQEQKPGLPVYLHEDEEDVLREPSLNLTSMFGEPVSMDADHLVKDGQILDLFRHGDTLYSCARTYKRRSLLLFQRTGVADCGRYSVSPEHRADRFSYRRYRCTAVRHPGKTIRSAG